MNHKFHKNISNCQVFTSVRVIASIIVAFWGGSVCHAQTASQNPSAIISFATGESLELNSKTAQFGLVGISSGETVGIDLRFPASYANVSFTLESLDGGTAAAANGLSGTVGQDGRASVQFTAGTKPGLYRVALNTIPFVSTLQFWVPDFDSPNSNPPVFLPSAE